MKRVVVAVVLLALLGVASCVGRTQRGPRQALPMRCPATTRPAPPRRAIVLDESEVAKRARADDGYRLGQREGDLFVGLHAKVRIDGDSTVEERAEFEELRARLNIGAWTKAPEAERVRSFGAHVRMFWYFDASVDSAVREAVGCARLWPTSLKEEERTKVRDTWKEALRTLAAVGQDGHFMCGHRFVEEIGVRLYELERGAQSERLDHLCRSPVSIQERVLAAPLPTEADKAWLAREARRLRAIVSVERIRALLSLSQRGLAGVVESMMALEGLLGGRQWREPDGDLCGEWQLVPVLRTLEILGLATDWGKASVLRDLR